MRVGYSHGFLEHLAGRTLRQPAVLAPKEYGEAGSLEVLRTFRALVLDADGVVWDGTETRSTDTSLPPGSPRTQTPVISKTRYLPDGQGISFLRALGVRILIASAETDLLGPLVEKLNALPSCRSGAWPKVDTLLGLRGGKADAIEGWLTDGARVPNYSALWNPVVYMGDDRTDLEAMRRARMVVVPADAQRCAVRLAHVQTERRGGAGAIREFAELVLDARGVDESSLADS